jgi:plasmid stabilization system protein ParE
MARRRRAIIWSPEARADLSDIWDYNAKLVGRRRADEIIRGIDDASRLIEDHPLAGRARDEIRLGLCSIPARP